MSEPDWPFLGAAASAAAAIPERAMRAMYERARIDKGYEELRVGIEYDGPQHWTDPEQRDRDIDRYTALHDLGWTIIRVSNKLLRYRQGTFIGRVVAAMQAAGWRR
ncbi:hypothetical protein C3469_07765 [Mycobacterium kansasii]|nr:DUF559 domain-containing protein [Mycobacterium kansasii]POY02565.1 hypothetical protein C3479_08635 [Mycobacterium kansasii]POY28303.1 hypothetical protein C3469_07765 [Mycobacterium kansasii]POY32469.1 hypothetical protein C3478_11205 [Mycobacterium kansasii]